MRRKPDYGLDSPMIITGLLIIGGLFLVIGLIRPRLFHLPMRWIGIIAFAYLLQAALSMVYYSKVGKLRMRESILNSIPWRGDEHVLDIGCGRGLLVVAAAHRLTSGHAVGIDMFLPNAITGNVPNAAVENATIEGVNDRVEVQEGDARKLPFPDASFDTVISNFVLHEMRTDEDRQKMIEEIARVLKPGGHLALRDFIFTDLCLDQLHHIGFVADRERIGGFSFWAGAILNFGFFRLYHVTGRKPQLISA